MSASVFIFALNATIVNISRRAVLDGDFHANRLGHSYLAAAFIITALVFTVPDYRLPYAFGYYFSNGRVWFKVKRYAYIRVLACTAYAAGAAYVFAFIFHSSFTLIQSITAHLRFCRNFCKYHWRTLQYILHMYLRLWIRLQTLPELPHISFG